MAERIHYIIGIDYGTTFTGISYVTSSQTDMDDINILQMWPGISGNVDGNRKTPTRIAYGRENQFQGNKWGFEVGPSMKAYAWTKLLLDQSTATTQFDDPDLAQITGKGVMEVPGFCSAQDVCRDFLTEVRKHIFARLEKEDGEELMRITPVECWLTVPAIWSNEAKEATKKAAIAAGFCSRSMDSINVIPEPEAAAVAALKKDSAPGAINPVKDGDVVMICDCGGGTVDLTTYSIIATQPVLDFEELIVGLGGKCGATYIDRNLYKLMSQRFGKSFDDLPPTKRGPGSAFMTSFEFVKRNFGASDDTGAKPIGPLKLASSNSSHYDDDERMVMLSQSDLKSLFDPVIGQVIKLVADQVAEAKKLGRNVDRMILVGGFGDSPYLFTKLRAWCKNNGNIKLVCPPHPQSAIVLGAALRGLCGTAPSSTRCKRHYGYTALDIFRAGIDKESDAYFTPFKDGDNDDGKRVRGRMTWMMGKGEKVTPETNRSVALSYDHQKGSTLVYTLRLYSCVLDVGADRVEDSRVKMEGSIQVDFSNVNISTFPTSYKDGKLYYSLEFQLRIDFGHRKGELDFSSWVNGRRCGNASITYGK